jgi:hypothetical protein
MLAKTCHVDGKNYEQMTTRLLSHVNGQLVWKNECSMVYNRDIIKVKTGIHDIAVFQ